MAKPLRFQAHPQNSRPREKDALPFSGITPGRSPGVSGFPGISGEPRANPGDAGR